MLGSSEWFEKLLYEPLSLPGRFTAAFPDSPRQANPNSDGPPTPTRCVEHVYSV